MWETQVWVGKIPWRRKWQPTPVLLPRKFHGWRSLVGYSPWGQKSRTRLSNFTVSFFANLYVFIWRIFVVLRVCILSHFSTLCDLWSIVCEAPLPTGFSRQGYWSGFLFPSPGDAPDAGIEPTTLMSPGLAGRFLTTSITWEAHTLDYAQFFELSKNRTKIMFSRSP